MKHKSPSSRSQTFSRRREPSPYDSKIVKPPTKQTLEAALRHAVTHRDHDAFEDYDEWDA